MNKKNKFRSSNWYNSKSHRRDTFIHRGWMRNQGHPNHLFDGRPVIGICNTWSELTPCNGPVSYTHLTLPTNREV